MAKEFEDLPGWKFYEEEISYLVYEVKGIGPKNESVCFVGTELELDSLLEKCRCKALEMVNL